MNTNPSKTNGLQGKRLFTVFIPTSVGLPKTTTFETVVEPVVTTGPNHNRDLDLRPENAGLEKVTQKKCSPKWWVQNGDFSSHGILIRKKIALEKQIQDEDNGTFGCFQK